MNHALRFPRMKIHVSFPSASLATLRRGFGHQQLTCDSLGLVVPVELVQRKWNQTVGRAKKCNLKAIKLFATESISPSQFDVIYLKKNNS